jgi:hypothetical protein
MKMIEWPTNTSPKDSTEMATRILLPELDLTDADYEAAGKALRNLEDCFFEVVFVHEVAARHCRERQLAAELSRNRAIPPPNHARARNFIEQWKKPTPLSQINAFAQRDSRSNRPKR